MSSSADFQSSKLGTREYWDSFYDKELENFKGNADDEGEIWFGHARMVKVVRYLLKDESVQKTSRILDIGCGNGAFLLEMAEEGYSVLYGMDYSLSGIQLARDIAASQDKKIRYTEADFLDLSTYENEGKFDVCHDKGTYDAISLRPGDADQSRDLYITNLKHIMNEHALFIITSCNWTLEEICLQFTKGFTFVCDIPAPKFQYGGKSGSTVSTAVFKKS